jgi:hypothetical protein
MSAFPALPDPESGEGEDRRLLSEAVLYLDSQGEAAADITDVLARYISPEAALYMARQRGQHTVRLTGPPLWAQAATAWLDGFLAGMIVQHRKNQPQPGGEDGERAGTP